jgi:hypothetical protein
MNIYQQFFKLRVSMAITDNVTQVCTETTFPVGFSNPTGLSALRRKGMDWGWGGGVERGSQAREPQS